MNLTVLKFGLKSAFAEIEHLGHEVTSSGNPIVMNLNQRYVIKGIGTEKKISSIVEIKTTDDQSKTIEVKDKWDGEIPSGAIRDVSFSFSSSNTEN